MADGYAVSVIVHTERGFRYKGEPRSFIPRWGLSFTGEGEFFTDTSEYRLGLWGFNMIGADEPDYVAPDRIVFTD